MEILFELISGPLFTPLIMLMVFVASQWYNTKKSNENIERLVAVNKSVIEKDIEQDDKIHKLEKDMVKVMTEQEGIVATLMAKIENLEELVKSLRDWIHTMDRK